jgi:uncharacterized protein (TIGR00255 family)
MLRSMTGFGKVDVNTGTKKVQIEIRTLNSKSLDLNLKIPALYREKENEIRNIIGNSLQRGKVDLSISIELIGIAETPLINREVVKDYFNQFSSLASEIGIKISDPVQIYLSALRMPESLKSSSEKPDEEELSKILNGITETLGQVNEFRIQEGKILEKDLKNRIQLINKLLTQVDVFEKIRIEKIRDRIQKQLTEALNNQEYDKNRLEQELIYYIEKLDITEEKVRLKNHCDYFMEIMHEEIAPGKKLGFVSQEIGREINTLGSKANDSEIQKIVVEMKDELEKIKEQLMNVL